MKKEFKVEGMSCMHCRKHVEDALNQLDGVSASVSLDPPMAIVEFTTGNDLSLEELQRAVSEDGEYTLSEM